MYIKIICSKQDRRAIIHADNWKMADPLVTPASIVPEFYFLPLYAILRAVPNKALGVLAMLGAILVLIVLPYIDKSFTRSHTTKPLHRIAFWMFIANFLVLGWLGGEHATATYVALSQFCMTIYFSYFLIILPGLGMLDNAILSTSSKKH